MSLLKYYYTHIIKCSLTEYPDTYENVTMNFQLVSQETQVHQQENNPLCYQ